MKHPIKTLLLFGTLILLARTANAEQEPPPTMFFEMPPPLIEVENRCHDAEFKALMGHGLHYVSLLADGAAPEALKASHNQLATFQTALVTCRVAEAEYLKRWLQSGGVVQASAEKTAYDTAAANVAALATPVSILATEKFMASVLSLVRSQDEEFHATLRGLRYLSDVERIMNELRDFIGRQLQEALSGIIDYRRTGSTQVYDRLQANGNVFRKTLAGLVTIYGPKVTAYGTDLKTFEAKRVAHVAKLDQLRSAMTSTQQATQSWLGTVMAWMQSAQYHGAMFWYCWGWAGWFYYGIALAYLSVYHAILYGPLPQAQATVAQLQQQAAGIASETSTTETVVVKTLEDLQKTKQALVSIEDTPTTF